MANFKEAVELVIAQEGGFVDDPEDEGGTTKYGISWNFIRLLKKVDKDYSDWTVDNIVNLTMNEAEEIYKKHFWDAGNFDIIPIQRIATILFSMGVLTNIRRVIRFFQRALNEATRYHEPLLKEDGYLGEKTADRYSGSFLSREEDNIERIFKCHMVKYLLSKVNKKSKKTKNLKGWLNRLYEL